MEQLTQHSAQVSDLVEQNRNWLTRLIATRCDDAAAAEDVLQEVSLAVVRTNDRPDSASRVRSWLCTIALRQCALRVRRLVRQRRLLDNAAEVHRSDDDADGDPLLWMMRSEHASLIRTALLSLSEDARWILLQKYQHKRTYAEIAKDMNTSAHKVEYKILKARQQLHHKLVQLGIDHEVSV